jgi:FkbM family methyltransferase
LRLPSRDIFSTIVRYGDYVQIQSAYLYLRELSHSPVVVDIGAHHGIYAVILGKLVQQMKGKVIAVEPSPLAFKVLRDNIRMNDLERTVSCERVAIMEHAATVHGIEEGDQSRIAGTADAPAFAVEALTLTGLLDKYGVAAVDLLIIDVEGAELNVLRGIDWMRYRFGRIFCELHPYNWKYFHYSGVDVAEFLARHGYRCFDMYFREHKTFTGEAYIGPTLFAPEESA